MGNDAGDDLAARELNIDSGSFGKQCLIGDVDRSRINAAAGFGPVESPLWLVPW